MRKWMFKSLALAAAAAGFCMTHSAKAETITATLESVDPNTFPTVYLANYGDVTGGAGAIEWQGNSSNAAPFNGAFDTYCIDLIQDIYFGSSYTYTIGTLSDAPNPGAYPSGDGTGPMGVAKADEIDELFGADYAATLMTGQTGEDNREAMQLAIWNIVYDTDTTVNSGSFSVVSGVDANAISTANTWLVNAANPANQVYDANDVVSLLGQGGAQDQLAVIPTCPLPSTVWGGGVLLAGVAAVRIRKAMTQTA